MTITLAALLFLELLVPLKHTRRRPPRHRASLELTAVEAKNEGAIVDKNYYFNLNYLPPPTYFGEHSALVMHDMFVFHDDEIGINPNVKDQTPRNEAAVFTFIPVGRTEDALEIAREQQRQTLGALPQPTFGSLAVGLAMFGVNTALVAHAPLDMRVVLDGPVHFGPATFDAGGMGMGFGGHLPANLRHWETPARATEPDERGAHDPDDVSVSNVTRKVSTPKVAPVAIAKEPVEKDSVEKKPVAKKNGKSARKSRNVVAGK